MSATVRPEKFREAVNAKLADAVQYVYELGQAEQPELNRYHDADNIIVNFLHAARGVYPVTETCAGMAFKSKWPWRDAWQARLTDAERDLWRQMRTERVAQEHGEGVELISNWIPITRGSGAQDFTNYAVLGIPRPERGPAKGGFRFAAYPDRLASEVARDYLALCQRFVDDFERDHAHLFRGKTP